MMMHIKTYNFQVCLVSFSMFLILFHGFIVSPLDLRVFESHSLFFCLKGLFDCCCFYYFFYLFII